MRFSFEQECQIVQEYKAGSLVVDLALKRDCSPQTICNILTRGKVERRPQGQHMLCRLNSALTLQHQQIIEGLLLGDGSVLVNPNGKTPRLSLTTTEKEMAEHATRIFPFEVKFITKPSCRRWIRGKEYTCKESYQVYSNVDLCLRSFRDKWYPRGNKIVPTDLSLSPFAVKYWFFGDGSSDYCKKRWRDKEYAYPRISLYTNGFSQKDCEILLDKLRAVGLSFGIGENRKKPILTTSRTESVRRFFEYIGPCDLSCYNYKWKE